MLSALLPRTSGDVEVRIEQQRIARRYGIGHKAEMVFAIISITRLKAQELLFNCGGLGATSVRIDDERETQVQRPLEALQ